MTNPNTTDHQISAPNPGAVRGANVAQTYQLLTCALEAWGAYWTARFSARGLGEPSRANAR